MHTPFLRTWQELYANEASFRQWCDQQLWPQELLKLLEALEQNTPETDSSALAKLEHALHNAERCPPDSAAVDAALSAGKQLYFTSAWGGLRVGQPLRFSADLPPCEPFSLRLVALPAPGGADELVETQDENGGSGSIVLIASIQDAEVLPPVSSQSCA